MNISKTNINKLTAMLLIILLSGCMALWFKGYMLDRQGEQLRVEIESLEFSTAEIRSTLPVLKEVSREVLALAGRQFAVQPNPENWCTHLVTLPFMPSNFESSFKVLGTKPPLGMSLPWSLRQIDSHVHPGLVPCKVKLHITGTLRDQIYFFTEIDRQNRGMVITRMDLKPGETEGQFVNDVIVAFPQLYYTQDLDLIRRLAAADDTYNSGELSAL